MKEWINYLNKKYINLYAQSVKVFKLDKTATNIDDLYLEEKNTRIYLPPFEIRALYSDLQWTNMLGLNLATEEEQPQRFFINFDNMVQKIREIKNDHISDLYIEYSGTETPAIKKFGNSLTLYLNNTIIKTYDLTDVRYSTVRKLASFINNLTNWSVILEGANDGSENLINIAKTTFKNSKLLIYTSDTTYDNCTDVIEMGDAILNEKNRLYEITAAKPSGNFGWEYATWELGAELANIDSMNLPGNYVEIIKNNKYGFDKIDLE